MNKGFTLIELIIVVAILGIVTLIGVPQYLGYVENSKQTVAKNNLRTIYMQQQEYYRNNNAYYATGAACADDTSDINNNLFSGKAILVNDGYYYCITQGTVDDFDARAVEADGGGATYTIDEDNVTNF